MPGSDINTGQYWLEPYHGQESPAGIIVEIIRFATATENIIYGAAHASASLDDCKYIRTIIGCMVSCDIDDDDAVYAITSTGTTTDDTLTVTSETTSPKTVVVAGYGQAS